MAELSISKERLNYTIDLLVTMAVEEISASTGKDSKEVLVDFLASKTGKQIISPLTHKISIRLKIPCNHHLSNKRLILLR